jgi:hypothetical protein
MAWIVTRLEKIISTKIRSPIHDLINLDLKDLVGLETPPKINILML